MILFIELFATLSVSAFFKTIIRKKSQHNYYSSPVDCGCIETDYISAER